LGVEPGLVQYFSLTQSGTSVSGYLYGVQADSSAPNGLKETQLNVYGTSDGSRLVLNAPGLVARISGNGFDLSFPSNGYIRTVHFKSVSTEAVNAAVFNLRNGVGQQRQIQQVNQQRANLQGEIDDFESRLSRNTDARRQELDDVIKAKADIKTAQAHVDAANANIKAKQDTVTQAQAEVDAARAASNGNDSDGHIGTMQGRVGTLQGEVGTAQGELGTAQGELNTDKIALTIAKRALASTVARQKEIIATIRRDNALLHR